MKKLFGAALTIAALASGSAQAGVIAASPTAAGQGEFHRVVDREDAATTVVPLSRIGAASAAGASADEFCLTDLLGGVGRVLASVDDASSAPPNPFVAGLTADNAAHRAATSSRVSAAYDTAAAAAITDPLPEPATWLMMILGFFGLSFAVRRRSSGSGIRVRFS